MRVCEYTLKPAALTQHRNTRTCPRTLSACVEECSAGGTWFLALAGMPSNLTSRPSLSLAQKDEGEGTCWSPFREWPLHLHELALDDHTLLTTGAALGCVCIRCSFELFIRHSQQCLLAPATCLMIMPLNPAGTTRTVISEEKGARDCN